MNDCKTCDHKKNPGDGHCYMFREEPEFKCMKHTTLTASMAGTAFFDLSSKSVGLGFDSLDLALDVFMSLPKKAGMILDSSLELASEASSSGLDAVISAGSGTIEVAGSILEGAGDILGSIAD